MWDDDANMIGERCTTFPYTFTPSPTISPTTGIYKVSYVMCVSYYIYIKNMYI